MNSKPTISINLRAGEGNHLSPGISCTLLLIEGRIAFIVKQRVKQIATAPQTLDINPHDENIYIVALTEAKIKIIRGQL